MFGMEFVLCLPLTEIVPLKFSLKDLSNLIVTSWRCVYFIDLHPGSFRFFVNLFQNWKTTLAKDFSPWVNCQRAASRRREAARWQPNKAVRESSKTLFTWSGGPRLTPLDRGPPLHVNRP